MIGFNALLLTGSRSAWVGFAAGALFLLAHGDRRQRLRLGVQFAACGLLLFAVLRVPTLGTFIGDRFRNFNDIQSDSSYDDRVQGYKEAMDTILHEPFGEGLGSAAALHTGEIIGPHDSSFLESFYSLGWIGTVIYLGGIGLAGIRSFRHGGDPQSEMIRVGRAVIVAFIIQSPLNSVMLAQAGFFLWAVIALTMKEIGMRRPAYEYSSWQPTPEISAG
jgi:O-antigen ligase